ncbi:NADH-quinone oxidoreductase subunit A [Candidatus Poribacteria bacterium]|jgi:NADH-quinone oxidoreductase subunit A|nr:NADH-quinone oxidoreductase subunit A [Candidatus Poribacteria bacterium]
MLFDFANIFVFLVAGLVFILLNIAISGIAQTRLFSKEKSMAYECGEEPIGDTRIKFNTRFYVIALIFLIFDVEIVFLFPWAVVYRKIGMLAFVEMLIFIVILLVGLAYVWAKGDLEWIRSIQSVREDAESGESIDQHPGVHQEA